MDGFEKTEKRKIRFNIIDVIIIIAILAVAGAFLLRGNGGELINSAFAEADIEYVIKIASIQNASADAVKAGDGVFYYENDAAIGKVTAVEYKPATVYVNVPEGEIKKFELTQKIDLTITVSAKGKSDATGNYINGNLFVAPGKELHIYTKNIDFVGTVMSVNQEK